MEVEGWGSFFMACVAMTTYDSIVVIYASSAQITHLIDCGGLVLSPGQGCGGSSLPADTIINFNFHRDFHSLQIVFCGSRVLHTWTILALFARLAGAIVGVESGSALAVRGRLCAWRTA